MLAFSWTKQKRKHSQLQKICLPLVLCSKDDMKNNSKLAFMFVSAFDTVPKVTMLFGSRRKIAMECHYSFAIVFESFSKNENISKIRMVFLWHRTLIIHSSCNFTCIRNRRAYESQFDGFVCLPVL